MKSKIILTTIIIVAIFFSGCTNTMHTLTVNVVDPSGNPIEGADVDVYANYSLSAFDTITWRNINGTIQSSTETNQEGIVALQMPQAKYAVNVWANGYNYNGTEVLLDGDRSVTISLSEEFEEFEDTYTLNISQGGTNYSVTEELRIIMDGTDLELFSVSFSPEIEFFEKSGSDYVYYMAPDTSLETTHSYEFFAIRPGEMDLDGGTYTNGMIIEHSDDAIVYVNTNENGLYNFTVEAR